MFESIDDPSAAAAAGWVVVGGATELVDRAAHVAQVAIPVHEPDESDAGWYDVPDEIDLEAIDARGEREHPLPRFSVRGIDLAVLQRLVADDGTLDPVVAFAALVDLDARTLVHDHDVVELLAGLQRMRTWVEARESEALLAFARRSMADPGPLHPTSTDHDEPPVLAGDTGSVVRPFVAEELAARLGTSPRTVTNRLNLGSELAVKFPAARAAHASGRLEASKARILVGECTVLDARACARLELRVLDRAPAQSPSQFRRSVRRQVAALDPKAAEQRHAKACERRWVRIEPADDGMAWLTAFLPASDALVIRSALDHAAQRIRHGDPHEHRTLDQLRADVLVWPFEVALRTGSLPGLTDRPVDRAPGARAQLHVTVSLETLMGTTDDPADLHGYGPIPASMARRIAADGTWRRLVTDPLSGAVLDVGTTTYAPPADLLRHIHARDRHCRFPGCSRPAQACDVDHTIPFPHGPTADSNLAALCRRHHRFKHHDPAVGTARSGPDPAVGVEQPNPGTLTWRLPAGHEYVVVPEPFL